MKRLTAFLCIFISLFIIIFGLNTTTASANSLSGEIEVHAEGVVLIEQESGRVLYEKNGTKKLYPASTTKILTALLAIENGDLKEPVTVGSEIKKLPWDASTAKLKAGEQLTLENLLMALMLPSGNDAAMTIAVHIARRVSGNYNMGIDEAIESFTRLMNARAALIGAKNSNFANPHGYHDKNHYTTAMDLAYIAREAMKNDFFREVVKTSQFKLEDTYVFGNPSKSNDIAHEWNNTNLLVNNVFGQYFYKYATGIKTGFTDEAGYCLVSSASKDDLDLIAVVLNSTKPERWDDSRALLEYGFNNYGYFPVVEKGQVIDTLKIENNSPDSPNILNVVAADGFKGFFNKNDIQRITKNVEWDISALSFIPDTDTAEINGSISKGQFIGRTVYSLDGKTIFQADLQAGEDIKMRTFLGTAVIMIKAKKDYYLIGAGGVILLVILSIVLIDRRKKAKV